MKAIPILAIASTFLLASGYCGADSYSYLDPFDYPRDGARCERAPADLMAISPRRQNLGPFFSSFSKDGLISIFFGMGTQMYHPGHCENLFYMLKTIAAEWKLPVQKWAFEKETEVITFQIKNTYQIRCGSERNEFVDSFSRYDVVMYQGHSRNGRGPTFGTMTNYFRLGLDWPTIEIETRNPYFQNEEIEKTETYPIQWTNIDQIKYPYQYRGAKIDSSLLPQTAYTINIKGAGKDLYQTPFTDRKQILWFYSCYNAHYWLKPLRHRLPNPKEKFIFGTRGESFWGLKPAAAFIMSLAEEQTDSLTIIDTLNATKDCDHCFTSY